MNAFRAGARGLGELLISLGVVLLLFVAWQLYWTDFTADRAQASTTEHGAAAVVGTHPESAPGRAGQRQGQGGAAWATRSR